MPLSNKDIKEYYNRCKPDEPLEPNDSRNVNLDIESDELMPRGRNWTKKLAQDIELSDDPVMLFFSGLPGSGKSTEIKRLIHHLDKKSNLLPIYVDAKEYIDLSNTVNLPDILAALAFAADKQLLELEGKNSNPMKEGFGHRFFNFLTRTDIQFNQYKTGLGGQNIIVQMKDNPTARALVRDVISNHNQKFINEIHNEFLSLQERAQKLAHSYEGIILILDSLEKLRGTSSNWVAVLQSAEALFSGGAPYLKLPVHVVYTLPPALISHTRMHDEKLHFMPMIRLYDQKGEKFEHGIASARELIRRRIPDDALEAMLGEDFESKIFELIKFSGGYPRDLVRMLRMLLSEANGAEGEVSEYKMNRIFQDLYNNYRSLMRGNAFEWLAKIARTKDLILEDEHHHKIADSMLTNNVILCYLNSKKWWDLHPALYNMPEIQEQL